jgi:hypothetical protein
VEKYGLFIILRSKDIVIALGELEFAMAKVWRVYEGQEPTQGGPWAELPMQDATSVFELRSTDLVSDLEHTPKFGNVTNEQWHRGYKHVVVEIGRKESAGTKWKAGFYRSKVKPKDAFNKLIRQALVTDLGAQNVIEVKHGAGVDSYGEDAIRITVVLAPDAIKRLAKKDAPLNALVRLRERLSQMGESRIPIVEYATEAELA